MTRDSLRNTFANFQSMFTHLFNASVSISPFGIFGTILLTGNSGELIDWLIIVTSVSSSSTVGLSTPDWGFVSSSSSSSLPESSSSSEIEGKVQTRVLGLLLASWNER